MNKKVILVLLVLLGLILACSLGTPATPVQIPPPVQPQVTVITVEVPVIPTQQPSMITEVPPVVITQAPPVVIEPPQPTQVPVTRDVLFTANRDLSCAEGPNWALYWFVDQVKEGDTVPIKAVNGEYGLTAVKGKDCWVWLLGDVEGDLSSLPYKEAPKLPIVEVTIKNDLGVYVYVIIYDWNTGERVKTLALDPEMNRKVKLPSGYYSIQGYNKKDQQIYQSDIINLAVGDGQHIPGLEEGICISLIP